MKQLIDFKGGLNNVLRFQMYAYVSEYDQLNIISNIYKAMLLAFDAAALKNFATLQKASQAIHRRFQRLWHEFYLQRVKRLHVTGIRMVETFKKIRAEK